MTQVPYSEVRDTLTSDDIITMGHMSQFSRAIRWITNSEVSRPVTRLTSARAGSRYAESATAPRRLAHCDRALSASRRARQGGSWVASRAARTAPRRSGFSSNRRRYVSLARSTAEAATVRQIRTSDSRDAWFSVWKR